MTRQLGTGLEWLGSNGPAILVTSLAVGFAVPELGKHVGPVLPVSAFLLVWGSFLSAAMSPVETRRGTGSLAFALAFVAFGAFAVTSFVLWLTPLAPDIELAARIAALAPPTGSLAALAAMMALKPRLALLLMLSLTIAAPLTMPIFMAAFLIGDSDFWSSIAGRLIIIVGLAAILAMPFCRRRMRRVGALPSPMAACGISVIGLVVVGVMAAGTVRDLLSVSNDLASLLTLVIGLNVGLTIVGAALFLHLGMPAAITIGLAAGNRNVTLTWAAGTSVLPAEAQGYLAVSVATVLLLPLLLKLALHIGTLFFAKAKFLSRAKA
jgi:arsenite transporter